MKKMQMDLIDTLSLDTMSEKLRAAVLALREGQPVLMLDADERENEGDLIIAAEKITCESMNFLIKKGSGVVCLAMPKSRLDYLGLPLMSSDNTNYFETAFTVSIEAKHGVSTGVSAKDRAHTILVAMNDDARAEDLARPGHVFPLAAKANGVFDRMGHTEGSVDLMAIAGLRQGAVLCELMNEDGSMTIGADRERFAALHNMPVISVDDVLFHRIKMETGFSHKMHRVDSQYGALCWNQFGFGERLRVDIFTHSEKGFSGMKAALIDDSDLAKRFVGLALKNDDDALAESLKNLADQKIDMVAMTSFMAGVNKNNIESEKIRAAYLCKALKQLNMLNIELSTANQVFMAVAQHFI